MPMSFDDALVAVRAGKRVIRISRPSDVLVIESHIAIISEEVWGSYRLPSPEERSAQDWVVEEV